MTHLDDSGGLGVDDALGSTGQPVDLSLGVPARGDRRDLLDAWHVLPPFVLERLPQVLQADQGRTCIHVNKQYEL